MILVLSNVANESATAVVEMFPPDAASLVTASDFNLTLKAAISVANCEASELAVGAVRISPRQISGVISTVSYLFPQEFYYIEPPDRAYVCAEMTAFLIYFLSELRCRKLNPPSTTTLSGLGMHRMEWMKAAHRLGIPVWPIDLRNGVPAEPAPRDVAAFRATIVGARTVESNVPEQIQEHLRTLARAFSMPYLCADFLSCGDDEYSLAGLWSVPDITAPANREAIVDFMSGAAA